MAEFKDISLFETIIPTREIAENLFIQVSATEKVSLASIADLTNVPGAKLGNWNPLAGTITSNDTVLQALQKLQGNMAGLALTTVSSSIVSTVRGGYAYISNLSGNSISIDTEGFNENRNCAIIVAQGGQMDNVQFSSEGSVTANIKVQRDLNDICSSSEQTDSVVFVIQYVGTSLNTATFLVNASIYQAV